MKRSFDAVSGGESAEKGIKEEIPSPLATAPATTPNVLVLYTIDDYYGSAHIASVYKHQPAVETKGAAFFAAVGTLTGYGEGKKALMVLASRIQCQKADILGPLRHGKPQYQALLQPLVDSVDAADTWTRVAAFYGEGNGGEYLKGSWQTSPARVTVLDYGVTDVPKAIAMLTDKEARAKHKEAKRARTE